MSTLHEVHKACHKHCGSFTFHELVSLLILYRNILPSSWSHVGAQGGICLCIVPSLSAEYPLCPVDMVDLHHLKCEEIGLSVILIHKL